MFEGSKVQRLYVRKMMMKRYCIFLLCLLCFISCGKLGSNRTSTEEAAAIQEIRYEYGIPVDSFRIETGTIQKGATLGGLLKRLGASATVIRDLTLLDREVFDPRDIRPGKQYMAFYGLPMQPTDSMAVDTALCYFVYEKSLTESVVFDLRDSLHIDKQQKEITIVPRESAVTVTSSLWNACVEAGANPQLALELSDIYAWTVDFFALQANDHFHVYYDEKRVDSTFVGIGRVYAASYVSRGDTLNAYYYENGDTRGYFDETGRNLRKTFLKAPLNYRRISSGFTYARKHPIYKTVRPHTGVDYAAPAGTPVVALGDGVVTMKAYKGGGGNTVKIRHNSTYTTGYLHLSKYAKGLAVGKRVSQGEVIGYVGSTGASTGPHLDFRVWKNGSPINPLTMESPSANPIPKAEMDTFKVHISQYKL